jgi:hypothetical protein
VWLPWIRSHKKCNCKKRNETRNIQNLYMVTFCPLLWRSRCKPSWSLKVFYISVSWLLGMVLSDRASIKSTISAQSDYMMLHCLKGRYVAFCKLCEHNSIIIAYFAII